MISVVVVVVVQMAGFTLLLLQSSGYQDAEVVAKFNAVVIVENLFSLNICSECNNEREKRRKGQMKCRIKIVQIGCKIFVTANKMQNKPNYVKVLWQEC
jgi:hypothetical protein